MSQTFWGQSADSEDEVVVTDSAGKSVKVSATDYDDAVQADRPCGSQPMTKPKHYLRAFLDDPFGDKTARTTSVSSGSGAYLRAFLADPFGDTTARTKTVSSGSGRTAKEKKEEKKEETQRCPSMLRRGIYADCLEPPKPSKSARLGKHHADIE